MAEKRGPATSDLYKSKKKNRLEVLDPVMDFLSNVREVVSMFSKNGEEDDFNPSLNFFSDISEIKSALEKAKTKVLKDRQKENEGTIKCVASEIGAMRDASQLKHEKERQKLSKELTRKSKECESSLKGECEKLGATCEKFRKDLATHGKAFKDIMSKFKAEKELLSMQDKQQSEKYRTAMSEVDRECLAKINAAKRDMLKEKPGQEGFQRLYNYLRSLVEDAANEEEAEDAAGEEKAEDAADVEVQKMPDSSLVTLSPSVGSKIRAMRDAAQLKNEKERQKLSRTSREYLKSVKVLLRVNVKSSEQLVRNFVKSWQHMGRPLKGQEGFQRLVDYLGSLVDPSQLS